MEITYKIKFDSGKEIELSDEKYKEWIRQGREKQEEVIERYMRSDPPPHKEYIGYDWEGYVNNWNAFIKEFNAVTSEHMNTCPIP